MFDLALWRGIVTARAREEGLPVRHWQAGSAIEHVAESTGSIIGVRSQSGAGVSILPRPRGQSRLWNLPRGTLVTAAGL